MIHSLIAVSLLMQNSFSLNGSCFPDGSGVEPLVKFLLKIQKVRAKITDFFSYKDKSSEQTITIQKEIDEAPFQRLNRDEEENAHAVLLELCKNHLQGHLLKNKRPTESHSVQQLLNQEYKEELSVVGLSDIVQYCQKYNR